MRATPETGSAARDAFDAGGGLDTGDGLDTGNRGEGLDTGDGSNTKDRSDTGNGLDTPLSCRTAVSEQPQPLEPLVLPPMRLQNHWCGTALGRRTARSGPHLAAEPLFLAGTLLQNTDFCSAPARRTAPHPSKPDFVEPSSVQASPFCPTAALSTARSAADLGPPVLQSARRQNPQNRWFCAAPSCRTMRSPSQIASESLILGRARLQNRLFCTPPPCRTGRFCAAPACRPIRSAAHLAGNPLFASSQLKNRPFCSPLYCRTVGSAQRPPAEPPVLHTWFCTAPGSRTAVLHPT